MCKVSGISDEGNEVFQFEPDKFVFFAHVTEKLWVLGKRFLNL